MKVKIVSGIAFSLLVFLVFIPLIRANVARRSTPPNRYGITIILDAGHGGKDGGASSKSGVVERDLVFNITLMVKEQLQLQGFDVRLTRADEHDLASPHATNRKRDDLAARVAFANSIDDAILISIHANAIGNERWRGAQVFYDASSLENKELATHIMTGLRNNLDGLDREQRPISNIYILRHTEIPAALVEVGFLSNPDEARLLADENYQKLIAYAIFEGILAYVEETNPIPFVETQDE